MNFFTNDDEDIKIYTKNTYFEDDIVKFFNLSSVTIESHPDMVRKMKKSIVIPTAIQQPVIMDKCLYNLISPKNDTSLRQNYSLKISEIISTGGLSDLELSLFSAEKVSIMAVRTGFNLKNIDVYREETEHDSSQLFLMPINSQTKEIRISKFKNLII